MNMKRIIIALLILAPSITAAQEVINVNNYRRRVVEYSNQLKMAGENRVAATEKSKMVKTGFLPALSATANANYQVGNSISFGDMKLQEYNYNANLQLQQIVWGGGAISAQWQASRVEEAIARMGEQQTLDNVIYGADITYWAFAAAAQQRDVVDEYVRIVSNLMDVVKIRFQDGYVSKTDLLMVETRLNEAQINKLATYKMYLTALQNINTLIGQHVVTEYAVGDSVTIKRSLVEYETLDNALNKRPEYKIADLNVSLQNINVKLARSQFNPQLAVGIQGVYGTPALNFTGIPKVYGTAYAQLNVPIFNWGERRHSVAMVRSAIRAMEYSKADLVDQISSELGTARVSLEQSRSQVEISTKNLAIAAENLALNTFSYSEGRLPILDVLQSQLSWIQSYTAYVNSNYQYKVAQTDYLKAAGEMKVE